MVSPEHPITDEMIEAGRRAMSTAEMVVHDSRSAAEAAIVRRIYLAMRSATTSPDRTELEQAANGLDHVAAALNEVHALSDVGDPKFDASMFGQIAACEHGASLLRRSALSAMPKASDLERK